ncbi:MAG: GGDEF domain-containing protein [Methylococcaceae bacterium]|nr:MAG: GGDEF domain-containing protein [Methylococcaceae bacterium]
MIKGRHLEETVEALLQDERYAGHPLRQALEDVYRELQDQLHQIERITRISDQYQSASRDVRLSLTERCRRQLKTLEKIIRISDGYQKLMRENQESLKDASLTDVLTGLGNRRRLQDHLHAESIRSGQDKLPLTLVLADVDRFKEINDTHGHDAGDKTLIAIARALQSGLRSMDICGRWGGEEFLIVMPELDAVCAYSIIEQLRMAMAQREIPLNDHSVRITVCFGIAQWRSEEESIEDALHRADAALLVAKRSGRNRCVLADETR